MDSTLVQVLKRSNLRGQVITYDETRRWPVSEYKVVFQVGILRRIEDAKTVVCTDCGDPHEEEVICHVGSEPRIHCPALGLIQVRPERLQRWEVDFESLGRLLAAELKLTADIQTITPGRIWLLGRRTVVDRKAELFLVCGAGWPDNLALLRGATRLQSSPAPIILCPDRLPGEPEWRDAGRSLFRLSEWMRLEDGRLSIDFDGFADLWHQTAGASERPLDPTPVAERDSLIKDFRRAHSCRIKDICFWAAVDRADLNKWKNGQPSVPNGGDKATRIEKLLQRGHKTRV